MEPRMAGDWIKMRTALANEPEVFALARRLKIDRFAVVGRLHRLWSWASDATEDGTLEGVTTDDIDGLVECPGFSSALIHVGWLISTNEGETVCLPNFDRHNGASAKRRASEMERQRENRTHGKRTQSVPNAYEMRTREEKRREEKNIPTPACAGVPPSSEVTGVKVSTLALIAEARALPIPPHLDAPDFRAEWEAWVDYRVKPPNKRPTIRAFRIHLSDLEKGNIDDAIAAIRYSIAGNYPAVYPDRIQRRPRNDAVSTVPGGGVETSGAKYRREQAAKSWD